VSERLSWPRDGAHWPRREHSRFVHAGGLRWHVQIAAPPAGGVPTLLLLHGAGASTHTWRGLLPLLAAQYRVIAPDLPGHAFTDALPPPRQSLPGMAHAIGELLDTLGVEPDAVIGHSAGAALMLRMALDGRLAAAAVLIGINAALLPFEGLPGLLYAPVARLLARSPLVPRLAAWRAKDLRAVRRLIASTGSMLDDDGVAWYARLLRCPAHVAGVLSMMAHWDLDPLQRDLPRLRQPLHLLVGERDAAVAPSQADRIAAGLHGVSVHRLPGLGHLAHEEAPSRVAEAVRAWLPARAMSPAT